MREESPLPLPPAEESRIADAELATEPESELDEPAPESIAEPLFVCDCEEWMRTACNGEPFYKEDEGKRFCVLHFPGKEKAADFDIAFRKKLEAKDFNFRGVWFPEAVEFSGFKFSTEANFSDATFRERVNFYRATFSAKTNFHYVTFSAKANFNSATFSDEADFGYAKFKGEVNFNPATFGGMAYFRSAEFKDEADFGSAKFKDRAYFLAAEFSGAVYFRHAEFSSAADFNSATFSGKAYFSNAEFKDQVDFSGSQSFGDKSALDLQFAKIANPERLTFHTMTLRPYWFMNIDSRKFVFTNVSWKWKAIIESKVHSFEKEKASSLRRLLAIACRQLAENAETNNRYEEASRFRYWAMDCQRQERWPGFAWWKSFWNQGVDAWDRLEQHKVVSFFKRDWLHWVYWLFSGYGERIRRAFAWLLIIWILFAWLYTQTGFIKPEDKSAISTANTITATEPDTIGQPLPFKRAFIYSLGVMSLQKPEPKPLTGTAQTLVLLETILGPLQAALLALAIRRKFMR